MAPLADFLDDEFARAADSGVSEANPGPAQSSGALAPLLDPAERALVTLRKSRTDQEGKSRRLGIPYGSSEKTCPVRSVQAWLDSARITDGPVFRSLDMFDRVQPERLSDKAVARIVKRRAKAVGLDPTRYAGHSLRAGLATSAAAVGASERVIMSQTGHRSADMVRRYIREGSLFQSNPVAMVGL
jgi:integrase